MKGLKFATIFTTLLFLAGCAMTMAGGQGVKSYSEMTPKDKLGFAMSLYNDAAGEYMWLYQTRQQEGQGFSKEDREFLKQYYQTLETSWKGINLYKTWVEAGTLPTPDMEDELVAIIRSLSLLMED